MVRIIKNLSFLVLILSLFLFSGCSTRYVCHDGSIEKDSSDCPIVDLPRLTQRQAEAEIDRFAIGYSQAFGVRYNRVNTYRDGIFWFSDVLFSDSRTGDIFVVVLKIENLDTKVICVEGCDFFTEYTEGSSKVVVSNQSSDDPGFSVY
jgi:hypothetical protein